MQVIIIKPQSNHAFLRKESFYFIVSQEVNRDRAPWDGFSFFHPARSFINIDNEKFFLSGLYYFTATLVTFIIWAKLNATFLGSLMFIPLPAFE